MKILILSDLHANPEALRAISESWDKLICLGDLVDYGLAPSEGIEFVRRHADAVVRGNHDHAVGYDADCGCAAPFREMSEATRAVMKQLLCDDELEFLRRLPESLTLEIEGARFYLCHAAPTDHFYRYLDKGLPQEVWQQEAKMVDADYILVGHTHQQFVKSVGNKKFLNPGSVGLSRDNPGKACYAIWKDGNIGLRQIRYDVPRAVERVMNAELPRKIREQLCRVLTGEALHEREDNRR